MYYGYRENLLVEVKSHLATYDIPVDQDRVSLHKGLFEDMWPGVATRIHQIAVAHLDCDWYNPVRYCLEAIADKMAPGGSVILDDYNYYGGCRTATDEFIRSRDDFQIVRNCGHLVIRRKVVEQRVGRDSSVANKSA